MASELNNEVQIMQENLCDLRKIAGWTAENLATKLGTTKQTISNIENQRVKMSRIQYIAIRAVFECEISISRDNTTLRKVMDILFGNVQTYINRRESIRTAITAIASIAAAGVSGLQLHSSAVALLGTLGHISSMHNISHGNGPSLMWLLRDMEGIEKIEIYNDEEITNEESEMTIDGIDVCSNDNYSGFKTFIEQKTPLQTWIEPIHYLDWSGFVNELSSDDRNDEVTVEFSGRKIDFDDFKRSIKDQNEERSERTRVVYKFVHKKKLDDRELSKNIDEVVKELQSDKFKELIEKRTGLELTEKYNDLESNYAIAKESEFYIVLAGVYSSGKSTFLNTLIRHNVLPTSSRTCTSKNCRIRHDGSLGNKLSLACYNDKGELVVEKRIFENDADCAAAFEEICPINSISEKYKDVEMMELGADLSHLYPESVSEDKFTIVLIDTPGMDSAQSSLDGKNIHAEIALDAISMDSKPMIILCADANKYEDKSIGEFMREIIAQSKEEGGGFNDRFLFLMNKSDGINYKANESE